MEPAEGNAAIEVARTIMTTRLLPSSNLNFHANFIVPGKKEINQSANSRNQVFVWNVLLVFVIFRPLLSPAQNPLNTTLSREVLKLAG